MEYMGVWDMGFPSINVLVRSREWPRTAMVRTSHCGRPVSSPLELAAPAAWVDKAGGVGCVGAVPDSGDVGIVWGCHAASTLLMGMLRSFGLTMRRSGRCP